MLSFFGFRKETAKKPPGEGEVDGFVYIGDPSDELRQKAQPISSVHPSTNVIVQPSKAGLSRAPEEVPCGAVAPAAKAPAEPPSTEATPALPELLGDIPFTLAPHILTVQAGLPSIPEFILPRDINENLASFCYDFTLENSVLFEP